jgi:WD40 repeat protein
VAFNRNGELLVTATMDRFAHIWNSNSGEYLTGLPHPQDMIRAEFTPDGRWVLTVCQDNYLRLWDPHKAQVVAMMQVHKGPLKWATFSHDGKWVLTVESDDAARLYPWEMIAPLQDLLTITKNRLGRPLSPEEKLRFLN